MVKIMENPIKMDVLGVPLFLETPIYVIQSDLFGMVSSRDLLERLLVTSNDRG